MARRGKYGAEKRQKELRKKKKREEKLERKQMKKRESAQSNPDKGGDESAESTDGVLEPGGETNGEGQSSEGDPDRSATSAHPQEPGGAGALDD